jgi:Putative methyltransferase
LIALRNKYKSVKKIFASNKPMVVDFADLHNNFIKDKNNILWSVQKSQGEIENNFYTQYYNSTLYHLNKLIAPQSNFLEIGAGFGFFSVNLANQNKQSHFYCFESDATKYQQFANTIELNGLNNILIFDKKPFGKQNQVSLKNFCFENKIESIDFLKLNLYGEELDFILNNKDVLNTNKNLVLLLKLDESICSQNNYSTAELYDYICQFGFTAFTAQRKLFGLKKLSQFNKNYTGYLFFKKEG